MPMRGEGTLQSDSPQGQKGEGASQPHDRKERRDFQEQQDGWCHPGAELHQSWGKGKHLCTSGINLVLVLLGGAE